VDALHALDTEALARDAAAMVRVPSVTGDELPALELLAARATALGLEADLHEHDLTALRAHPGHPGEEASRTSLWGLTVSLPGELPGRIARLLAARPYPRLQTASSRPKKVR